MNDSRGIRDITDVRYLRYLIYFLARPKIRRPWKTCHLVADLNVSVMREYKKILVSVQGYIYLWICHIRPEGK